MLTDVILHPSATDDQSNPIYTPDQFTTIANAIMALNDPSSFLNKITYLPNSANYSNQAQYKAAMDKFYISVFQIPPQGPLKPIGGPNSPLGTCNLQLQQGSTCSYSCVVPGPFKSFSDTLSDIGAKCNTTLTQ